LKILASFFKLAVIGCLVGFLLALLTNNARATNQFTCPDAGVFNELVGGVCWSQMFPIRLAGVTMFGGTSGVPSSADSNIACTCGGSLKHLSLPSFGFTLGMWQPSNLIEAVSHPFCFPSLGGLDIGGSATGGIGLSGSWGGQHAVTHGITQSKSGYFNVHVLTFPLLWMLNVFNVPMCNGGGYTGMDILLQSEFFPTWNNDLLAMLESPEEVLYSGILGQVASAGECADEFAGGEPIDSLYFTAGCWGSLYPMVGNNLNSGNPIRTSSLDAARMLALGFRLGIMRRTVGSAVICGPKRTYVIPKQQYRLQILYPNDETGNNPNPGVPTSVTQTGGVNIIASPVQTSNCAHWIGKSPLQWGEWDDQPGTGGNYVYLVWQWTDCCLGVLGGQLS
jgi:conjugal transfer pilus assembly protein TraU